MPFTTSHPAIILLLKRLWPNHVSLSGLMAGAMSPDLLYFLMMSTAFRGFSHNWTALFYFCLPAGVLFVWVFHRFVKYPLLTNLPVRVATHFSGLATSKFDISNPRTIVVTVLSVLVGGFSHFAWDSFTHGTGEIVVLLPFLKEQLIIFGISVPVYHLLQHISSYAGGLLILWFLSYQSNLPGRQPLPVRSSKQKGKFWMVTIISGGLFALLVFSIYANFLPKLLNNHITTLGLASWAGFFYSTILFGLYQKHEEMKPSTVSLVKRDKQEIKEP